MRGRVYSIITIFLLLGIWFLITELGLVPQSLVPSPFQVWNSFIQISEKGYGITKVTLGAHCMASLYRVFLALLFAIITGIPLGLLSGYNNVIYAIVNPIIEFYRPLPPLAYYTLLVLWMGIGEDSKIMLLYLAGLAPIYISSMSGVGKIKKNTINSAYMLGAGKVQCFFYVIIPSALPEIFTGMRTSIGVIYTTLVAAEMVAATKGIGWMVLDASRWMRSDIVFLDIIIMALTGIIINEFFLMVEKKVIHWRGA